MGQEQARKQTKVYYWLLDSECTYEPYGIEYLVIKTSQCRNTEKFRTQVAQMLGYPFISAGSISRLKDCKTHGWRNVPDSRYTLHGYWGIMDVPKNKVRVVPLMTHEQFIEGLQNSTLK